MEAAKMAVEPRQLGFPGATDASEHGERGPLRDLERRVEGVDETAWVLEACARDVLDDLLKPGALSAHFAAESQTVSEHGHVDGPGSLCGVERVPLEFRAVL